jgi:hypothetical protein
MEVTRDVAARPANPHPPGDEMMSHATKAKAEPKPPADLDLRSRPMQGPISRDMKRFDIFLIDSGWNVKVSQLVRSHLPLMYEYQRQDSLYILTHEQSIQLLKLAPDAIGHDPIVAVYDRYATSTTKACNYRGFRLNLGLFRHPEQALSRLHDFIRFIALHRTARRLDREIRRELHREGVDGMVKILREASNEFL